MGSKERKEREREQMQARILEAARRLFGEEGIKKVTMRRIAEAIEYSPRTIYLYYRDKEEILHALQEEGFQQMVERQRESVALDDPLEGLIAQGSAVLLFALEDPARYTLMLQRHVPHPDSVPAGPAAQGPQQEHYGLASYNMLQENVRRCLAEGRLPPGEVEVVTFTLWGAVHGMASLLIGRAGAVLDQSQQRAWAQRGMEYLRKLLAGAQQAAALQGGKEHA